MTEELRHVVIVSFDRDENRVKVGHAGFADYEYQNVRSLPEGRNTLRRSSGYSVDVNVKNEGDARLIEIKGADGVPIYASNPGQHPDGFEAGKRAFRLIDGVVFLAYDSGVSGKDELLFYRTYGQMEEQGAPLIAVPYVDPGDRALCFDVLNLHGKPLRTVKIDASNCKPYHTFDLSLGDGRLVQISTELTREPERDTVITFTPKPGIVLLDTMPPGDRWFDATRFGSLVWTVPSNFGSATNYSRRNSTLRKNPMPSFSQEFATRVS